MNFALLCMATFSLTVFRGPLLSLHGRMFDMDPADLRRMYLNYLAFYKVLVIVFNFVPWIALKIIL